MKFILSGRESGICRWFSCCSEENKHNLQRNGIGNGLQNLKIYSLKGYPERLFIDELCSYAANTAILKFRLFNGRNHFRLWVFASIGCYFYYWFWEWCLDLQKSCSSIILRFVYTSHVYWLIQLGLLKILVIQCYVLSDQIKRIPNYMR